MVEPQRILVFGTGAMAMLFGARLARAGHSVTLSGRWREGLRAIEGDGVEVTSPRGRHPAWSVALEARRLPGAASASSRGQASLALVLVKSHQSAAIGREVRHGLSPFGTVLTLQNGLGNREVLEAVAGRSVSLGVTTAAARVVSAGSVEEVATGRTVLPAEQEEMARLLSAAGFEAVTSRDIRPHVWLKLAINCAINPITALEGVTNGELLDRPALRRLAVSAASEVAAVAAARGVHLPADPVQQTLRVARRTAANWSSMLQDVRRGARTEIGALCGAVVARGRQVGVRTSVNEELLRRVRRMEEVASGVGAVEVGA